MFDINNDPRAKSVPYEQWRALINSACARFNPEGCDPKSFIGWARSRRIYGFDAVEVGSNVARVERTKRDARSDGVDEYAVILQLAGRSGIAQNDQAIELAAGDLALVDATRPLLFRQDYGLAQRLCLHLPRRHLVSHLGFEPQAGLLSAPGTLAGRLLFRLVVEGLEDQEGTPAQASAHMRLAIYDLLGAHFGTSELPPRSGHTDKLFGRIRAVIENRFADPDLRPGKVAAEAGISLRYLQKLFTAQGASCSFLIQSLRLDHAERLLYRRALLDSRQPLNEIALASGFRDYPSFSRMFHKRFGRAPGAHSRRVAMEMVSAGIIAAE